MKNFLKVSFILTGFLMLLFSGCETEPAEQDNSEENTVLYDDPTLLDKVSPNFYVNHIYRLELLGNNNELCDITERISAQGISLEKLNIYGTRKFLVNNSDVIMYSVPSNNSGHTIIIYKYDDIFQVMQAEYMNQDGQFASYKMTTTDGKLYYSLNINDENQVGNIITGSNPEIDRFNMQVYEKELAKITWNTGEITQQKASCCRKEASWAACIDCTTSAFRKSWLGNLSLALFGPEVYASIGISCINAGPGAVC